MFIPLSSQDTLKYGKENDKSVICQHLLSFLTIPSVTSFILRKLLDKTRRAFHEFIVLFVEYFRRSNTTTASTVEDKYVTLHIVNLSLIQF